MLTKPVGKFTFKQFGLNVSTRSSFQSLDRLNRDIATTIASDNNTRRGTTLVIGCPLPELILRGINSLQAELGQRIKAATGAENLVRWRRSLAALHLSVYGLLNPAEFAGQPSPWDFSLACLERVRSALPAQFTIAFSGLSLRWAGVAVGVSDSEELTSVRDTIGNLPGVSPIKKGALFNKVVVGRLDRPIRGREVAPLKQVFADFEDYEGRFIGTQQVSFLRLIQYGDELLENVQQFSDFPLRSADV